MKLSQETGEGRDKTVRVEKKRERRWEKGKKRRVDGEGRGDRKTHKINAQSEFLSGSFVC